MERSTLEGFGLTKEQIDTIMTEHGKAVNAAKEGKEALEQTIADQTAQLQRFADYDEIVRERDELRTNSSATTEELAQLREYKDNREYGDRMSAVQGERQFVNDITKNHVFGEFVTAAKSAENAQKTDDEIFQTVIDGHEQEYFKTKFGVRMAPTHSGKSVDDVKAVQDAKYKDNPYYHPKN